MELGCYSKKSGNMGVFWLTTLVTRMFWTPDYFGCNDTKLTLEVFTSILHI